MQANNDHHSVPARLIQLVKANRLHLTIAAVALISTIMSLLLPDLGGVLARFPWATLPILPKPWPLQIAAAASLASIAISSARLTANVGRKARVPTRIVWAIIAAIIVLLLTGIIRNSAGASWPQWDWKEWLGAAVGLGISAVAAIWSVAPALAAWPNRLLLTSAGVGVTAFLAIIASGAISNIDRGISLDRRWSAVVAALLLLGVLLFVQWSLPSVDPVPSGAGQDTKAPSSEAARYRRRGLRAAYVGVDGRVSTSKLQIVLWTVAILFMLIHIFVQGECLGVCSASQVDSVAPLRNALTKLLGGDLQPEYWALLGFPASAALYAKILTSGRALTKTDISASEQGGGSVQAVRETVSDDSGTLDIGSLQYLLFSLVGLGYVIVNFLAAPQDGLPAVPGFLVGLVGVSAAAYATKKTIDTGVGPAISAVRPETIVIGHTSQLTISGNGFRAVGDGRINFDAGATVVEIAGWHPETGGSWSATAIAVQLPTIDQDWKAAGLWPSAPGQPGEQSADLVVIDDRGNRSNPFNVRIRLPVPP